MFPRYLITFAINSPRQIYKKTKKKGAFQIPLEFVIRNRRFLCKFNSQLAISTPERCNTTGIFNKIMKGVTPNISKRGITGHYGRSGAVRGGVVTWHVHAACAECACLLSWLNASSSLRRHPSEVKSLLPVDIGSCFTSHVLNSIRVVLSF